MKSLSKQKAGSMIRVALMLALACASWGCSEASLPHASASGDTPAKGTTANTAARPSAAPIDLPPISPDSRAAKLLTRIRDVADPSILVVAHRGDWHSAPENSLAAIASCIEMGVDMVEIDVRPTRDGRFVLMHDKTLERTTTGSGKVASHTLAELQEFKLKDHHGRVTDQRPPSLEEALQFCRGRILVYLDKSELMIPELYQVVKNFQMQPHTFFYGERPFPDLKSSCGSILEKINYLPKIGDGTPQLMEYIEEYHKQLKPAAFVISFAQPTSPVLAAGQEIRKHKTRIWASPISPEMAGGRTDEAALNDPEGNWGWLIEQGATIFCTDRPREMLNYLKQRGQHD